MADTTLNITPGSGTQSATQTPQSAGSPNNGGTETSGVQPGTASDLLRSSNGVQLKQTPLTTVNLDTAKAGSAQPVQRTEGHHIHPVLGVFSAALFILAIALFWLTSRSVKNTTD